MSRHPRARLRLQSEEFKDARAIRGILVYLELEAEKCGLMETAHMLSVARLAVEDALEAAQE